jgi:hypothetical protein
MAQHDQEREASPLEEAKEGLNTTSHMSKPNQSTKSAIVLKSKLVPPERGKRLYPTRKGSKLLPLSNSSSNTKGDSP